MSNVFHARYLEQLLQRCEPGQPLLNELYNKNWVVHPVEWQSIGMNAKRPFAHPITVVEYLGCYICPVRNYISIVAHKDAISNHRLKKFDDTTIAIEYKIYRQGEEGGFPD